MAPFTPSNKAVSMGFYKQINGVWHKRCTGPAHNEPTWLPATPKYFYFRGDDRRGRQGKICSRCRLCENYAWAGVDGISGLVDAYKVRHFYDEVVNRIGLGELSRRTGLDRDAIVNVLTGKTRKVRLRNFRKVMLELISIRRKNEYSAHFASRRYTIRRVAGNGGRVCSGCGTPVDNFTTGCLPCWERRSGRQSRRSVA